MLAIYTYVAGFIALILVAVLAWFKGGRAERQVALAIVVAWIASALVPVGTRTGPSLPIVAIDVALLLYLLYQAAFAKRLWPIAAAGFQLLIIATHCAFAARPQMEQWGYYTAYYLWSWGVLLSLAAGCIIRRSKKE